MKYQLALAGLPALALAYPGMAGSKEYLPRHMEEREAAPEPEPQSGVLGTIVGTLTGTVSSLVQDIEGLTASLAAGVDLDNLRPQPGYTFQAPGPNDSRGPCPGLNLLANYGYLPHDGHVTLAQVVEATAVGFNMGTDLATILCVFAILTDGDIATESWYLGADPSGAGGLNRHSTVEADISPNREDYYNGCGDNHHLSSRLFTQNVNFASSSADKDFGLATMTQQFDAIASFSKQYNPYLYYFPFPSIVSFAAFAFYPNFFSNGTYGEGGVANYESISNIIGAQLDEKTGNFEYVPEKWPDNWYRRSFEYDAVTALTQGLEIYLTNPVGMPFGQLGTANLNAQTILCDTYQGLNSIIPLFVSGDAEAVEAAVTWAIGLLDPFFSNTVLGCPTSTISENSFLFANNNAEGGPLNPPPSVQANTGNNVYNKVYFTASPTAPMCSHTAAL